MTGFLRYLGRVLSDGLHKTKHNLQKMTVQTTINFVISRNMMHAQALVLVGSVMGVYAPIHTTRK